MSNSTRAFPNSSPETGELKAESPAHFAGVVPVDDFLATYLPPPQSERDNTIADIVTGAATRLAAVADVADISLAKGQISPLLLQYLRQIVSSFPTDNRPSFADIRALFPTDPDSEAHDTRPDITATRPGQAIPPKWSWAHAGTVLELKFKTDIFRAGGGDDNSEETMDALDQLATSARGLLASGTCFVFMIAVFKKQARILRFDHTGYRVTTAFDWTMRTAVLPTFFWRLYNPDRETHDGQVRMYGEDNTISVPTSEEKEKMYKRWQNTSPYQHLPSEKRMSLSSATVQSRWVKAVQNRNGERVDVDCFTIGPPLSPSDGLFSRATRVDRVLIQDDPDPTAVYALKDAWRQACRRPEADFYDLIHEHCRRAKLDSRGMAKCHGTLELSSHPHHATNSASSDALERCHTRALLTPVGGPITEFASTKGLVEALRNAVQHHLIAYEAGVLHRDISEGNVLVDEITSKGFLVDWDYAEFTDKGVQNFKDWFPLRYAAAQENAEYTAIDNSLQELTGTFPFMAIQILRNQPVHNAGHDLESFYWLLTWIILRHTAYPDVRDAKEGQWLWLFDGDPKTASGLKNQWICKRTLLPAALALYDVTESLRGLVMMQNPIIIHEPKYRWRLTPSAAPQPSAVEIRHEDVLHVFNFALDTDVLPWQTDDKAIPFGLLATPKTQHHDALGNDVLQQSAHEHESRVNLDPPVATLCKKRKHEAISIGAAMSPPAAMTGSGDRSEPASKKPKLKDQMKCKGGVVPQRKHGKPAKKIGAQMKKPEINWL